MQAEILARPSASVAKLTLEPGETVVCEVGAMVAMSSGFSVQTTASKKGGGGFWAGVKRMVAGENFFLNHFTATASGTRISILGSRSLRRRGASPPPRWLADRAGLELARLRSGRGDRR